MGFAALSLPPLLAAVGLLIACGLWLQILHLMKRGATRTGAGQGWADVWKQGHFAFEYKAMRRNLGEALKQLMTYALALDNPPLLVVCDTNIIEIHTHFTNAPSEVHIIALEEISEPANLDKLRWLFTAPDKFHPQRTSEITEEAAGKFAALAQSLNARGHAPQTVAHFSINACFACSPKMPNCFPASCSSACWIKARSTPSNFPRA